MGKSEELNEDFIGWLHKLTVAGYEKGIMIESDHADVIDFLYHRKLDIDDSLNQYQKFKIRWNALQSDPWISMKKTPLKQEDAWEVIGFHPDWIDEDFNPNGTRVGFVNAEGGFTCAKWCDSQDTYDTVDDTFTPEAHRMPSHYMHIPNTEHLRY